MERVSVLLFTSQKVLALTAVSCAFVALSACTSGSSSPSKEPEQKGPELFYFTAKDEDAGIRVWKTDGTAENTLPVLDLDESRTDEMIEAVDHFNGKLYAVSHGAGFFIYDLTARSKSQVTLHAESAVGKTLGTVRLGEATRATTILYKNKPHFVAEIAEGGCALWSIESDGKAKLTTEFPDDCPREKLVIGDRIYFSVNDVNSHRNLAFWNGTTLEFTEIIPGGTSYPENFIEHNGDLYFTADAVFGGATKEVFKMSAAGSTPTKYVTDRDVNYIISSFKPVYFNANNLYYIAENGGQAALWSFNGTASEKILEPLNVDVSIYTSTFWNGKLIGRGASATAGAEPVAVDSSGETLLMNIQDGLSSSYPSYFVPCGVKLCFGAEGSGGRELYVTDGTTAGTGLVKDINSGSNHSGAPYYYSWYD